MDNKKKEKSEGEKLAEKLPKLTEHHWQILPLHVEFQGAHAL